LEDEQKALEAADKENAKQMENVKPDPANMTAFLEKIQQVQAKSMGRTMFTLHDMYPPNIFGTPTVYVLEERQIGQRSYPTRYVVLYQDKAVRMPGYRLSWMTVPDDAIKAAQVASLVSEKQEEASKKEEEAAKKREAELDALTKKKDAAEKKQFKKGQADLEKELEF
jgi:hypothetical protein